MQVIGAGFARTGTLSLKAALETLGFRPCYHMVEVFARPQDIAVWQDAADGKPVDWKALFRGYEAEVDWPASLFYDQLMSVYPDAKVLLTVRDPERWYESTFNTIYLARQQGSISTLPADLQERFWPLIDALAWNGIFHGKFEDKQYAIDVFNRFNQEVQNRVPAGKLLVFEVREGWEPLCQFLGVDVPDVPFPRLNDTEAFQQHFLGKGKDTPPPGSA